MGNNNTSNKLRNKAAFNAFIYAVCFLTGTCLDKIQPFWLVLLYLYISVNIGIHAYIAVMFESLEDYYLN